MIVITDYWNSLSSSPVPIVAPALVAALLYLWVALGWAGRRASGLLALAWLAHGLMLGFSALRWDLRFGFASALSVTAWLVVVVYAVEMRLVPGLRVQRGLGLLGAAGVLLALFFHGVAQQTQLSPWLVAHWVFGLASYGLLAAAVVHALWMSGAERRMRLVSSQAGGNIDDDGLRPPRASSGVPLLTLERLTFGLAGLGLLLLTVTLLAGFFFSEQLYGKPWRWNHKTVLSVLAWLVLTTLVLGRWRAGWRGRKALRLLYLGAGLLLLSYVGSRFVLEVILQRGS